MLETLQNLGLGFQVALAPGVLWYGFIGCLVGTLVGVLPGVGPLAGISLLLPVTYGLDATRALVMLAGIYYGAMYGGSTTSILMRIPGEAASVMTCIDGYAMARKGRAGPALTIATVAALVESGKREIGAGGELVVDLAEVGDVDSSALSLLFEWEREARRRNVKISFRNLPATMKSLATLYGVSELIPTAA